MILRNRSYCEREHPLALRRHGVHLAEPVINIKRRFPPIDRPLARAHVENAFRRTFHVDLGSALVVVVQRSHIARVRVKGNRVRSCPL